MDFIKRIIATLSFFTRLPFWRLATTEKKHYERIVPLWPLAGWVTGGSMALAYLAARYLFGTDNGAAIVIAIAARILVTGGLHEDGFADFCDGFGGGINKERILAIMKDSHIGTYGVLGLILYLLLFYSIFPKGEGCELIILCVDILCKMCASTITWFLPYARKEEEAKSKVVYAGIPWYEKITTIVLGIAPAALLIPNLMPHLLLYVLPIDIIACALLYAWMHKRIGSYTGDCCGATFIIIEITTYLALLLTIQPC